MKPDQMVVATGTEAGALAAVVTNTRTAYDESRQTEAETAPSGPRLLPAPAPAPARPHTLIVTGELDGSSARALEAEIERLCEEGVTGITLDLRGLTYIDSVGVAVIAFRRRLCQRRGYEFSVIPGSPVIRRVFEQVGVNNFAA
jgi:anti-anti-sigma factor